jgi:hypothetical protein
VDDTLFTMSEIISKSINNAMWLLQIWMC